MYQVALGLGLLLLTLAPGSARGEGAGTKLHTETEEQHETAPQATGDGQASCELLYQELIQKHGQDYVSCLADVKINVTPCPKPVGFDGSDKENLNVVVALDASGSMGGHVPGGQKMKIAKDAVTRFVNTLPEHAPWARRVWAQGIECQKPKAGFMRRRRSALSAPAHEQK
jgi:hypothetical protein